MIGEQNGDNNSSLLSVFPLTSGEPRSLINQGGNLAITIPNDYNDLVYFSTEDSSIHYHLKIMDPPGGTSPITGRWISNPKRGDTSQCYRLPVSGSSYQPVYDLTRHQYNCSCHDPGAVDPGEIFIFDHRNASSLLEIRIKLIQFCRTVNFNRIVSLGYSFAKPNLFPTIPGVYDYLTLNISVP